MSRIVLLATAALLTASASLAAQRPPAPPTPVQVSVIEDGAGYLFQVDSGHWVYTSDKDEPGKSNCVDACAAEWQPVEAPADARAFADWTIITRPDKTRQWAYKGKAVYSYRKEEPGERKGDGLGGTWHLLKP